MVQQLVLIRPAHKISTHQTSCLWPATLLAGRKGSCRADVTDIVLTQTAGTRGSVDRVMETAGICKGGVRRLVSTDWKQREAAVIWEDINEGLE